jgi:hypothetical protein
MKLKLNKIKEAFDDKGTSLTWLAKHMRKSFSMNNCYATNKYQPSIDTFI